MQPQCTEKYHPVTLLVSNEFVCVLIKSSTSTCSILLFMDHVQAAVDLLLQYLLFYSKSFCLNPVIEER